MLKLTKKMVKDFTMKNELKKALDKHKDQVYNIRKDGLDALPFISKHGKAVYPHYHLVLTSLKEAWEEMKDLFPNPPVVAGGALRDLLLDECVKDFPDDFDVWVDCSHFDTTEEAEDALTLFASAVKNSKVFASEGTVFANRTEVSLYSSTGETNDANEFKRTIVDIIDITGRPSPDLRPDLNQRYRPYCCPIQIIGVKNKIEKPLDIVRGFHYNLVKAALTIDEEIHIDGSLIAFKEEDNLVVLKNEAAESSFYSNVRGGYANNVVFLEQPKKKKKENKTIDEISKYIWKAEPPVPEVHEF